MTITTMMVMITNLLFVAPVILMTSSVPKDLAKIVGSILMNPSVIPSALKMSPPPLPPLKRYSSLNNLMPTSIGALSGLMIMAGVVLSMN